MACLAGLSRHFETRKSRFQMKQFICAIHIILSGFARFARPKISAVRVVNISLPAFVLLVFNPFCFEFGIVLYYELAHDQLLHFSSQSYEHIYLNLNKKY